MKNVPAVLKAMVAKSACNKIAGNYFPSGILKYLGTKDIDLEKIQNMFTAAQEELSKTVYNSNVYTAKMSIVTAPAIGNICFNLDATTQAMKKIVDESGMRANGKIFVEMVKADLKAE